MVTDQSILHKEWYSTIPILWKRKLKKYAVNRRHEAIKTFMDLYSRQEFTRHSEFGLTILLPDSLFSILDSLQTFEEAPRVRLIHLLSNKEFGKEILKLETKKQKQLLLTIISVWHNPELNKNKIRDILLNFQLELTDTIYDLLHKEKDDNSLKTYVEILFTWGNPILPRLFTLYLSRPNDEIKQQILTLPAQDRILILQKIKNLTSLKDFKLSILLDLFGISNNELSFLTHLIPDLDEKNIKHLTKWFEKQVSPETILEIKFPDKKRDSFLHNYFVEKASKKNITYHDYLYLLVIKNEFTIADPLIELWKRKTNVQEILLDILIKSNITTSSALSFFKAKFDRISKKNVPKVIQYYLTSIDNPLLDVFSPSIRSLAISDWKTILKVASTFSTDIIPDRMISIFKELPTKQKNAIGAFMVNNGLLSKYMFLVEDFEIFRPVLFSDKAFSSKELVQLDSYLKKHIKIHLKKIILLGKKITYPIDHITDNFNKENIGTLVELSTSDKRLLAFWEQVLVDHYDVSLRHSLDLLIETSKNKKTLQQLTERLIDIDPKLFWDYYSNTPSKFFHKLHGTLKYAFQKSIKTIGLIIPNLSTQHNTYIVRKILPDFSSRFPDILYSLFIFTPTEPVLTLRVKYIQEMIKHDSRILSLTLVRCNKVIGMKKKFVSMLIEPNLKNNLILVFHTINNNKLENLVGSLLNYVNSLAINNLKDMLLDVTPSLGSDFLIKDLIQLLTTSFPLDVNLNNVFSLLDDFEEKIDYTDHGIVFITRYLATITGKSTYNDLTIFEYFQNKSRIQSIFLTVFFEKIPNDTINSIVFDPNIVISDKTIAEKLVDELETRNVTNHEKYFVRLFKTNTKEPIKRAILPKLGKYCTWGNLGTLMQLPAQNKFQKEYQQALDNFAKRFNLQNSKSLVTIWQSGLKDVYNKKISNTSTKQTECPNCGKPVLEKQLNCGFCIQKLTCPICRQSVVKLDSSNDIVRCPSCSSFFHRNHLSDALKIRKACPVCNAPLTAQKVSTLPKYIFGYL